VNLLGYWYWRDHLNAQSMWLDLWPNFVVDLFSVWLVARIVEAYLTSREEMRDVALRTRGSMNFTMQRANDLLPEPYPGAIRALRDETGWMRTNADRRDLPLNDYLRGVLRIGAQQLDDINSGADALRRALLEVERTDGSLNDALDEAHEADKSHPARWDLQSLERLSRAWRISRDQESEKASADVQVAVDAVREESSQHTLAAPAAHALSAHLAAIEVATDRRMELVNKVGLYTAFVRELDGTILREAAKGR